MLVSLQEMSLHSMLFLWPKINWLCQFYTNLAKTSIYIINNINDHFCQYHVIFFICQTNPLQIQICTQTHTHEDTCVHLGKHIHT